MRRAPSTRSLFATVFLFLPNCASNDLSCRVAPYLTMLYLLAGALALLLLVVIAAAIHQYRRNKRVELKPE
ncbi:MAG: hypothetical protein PW735_11570 [Acidobacteriaceae bacterium]|nr:hypothetical protein [Acidobacteriaceae bacterium]